MPTSTDENDRAGTFVPRAILPPEEDRFFKYYVEQSATEQAHKRTLAMRNALLRIRNDAGMNTANLDVLEVGCNAGTQCMLWASAGHRVHGIEINANLLSHAKQRADKEGLVIDFRLGSATELSWPDSSMDICIMAELLEHVPDWQQCLREAYRVLRGGGLLYLSTTNRLCPKQQEFSLPLYSWYPKFVKWHFEKLAITTRPDLVSFAQYPAVNWFSYASLKNELTAQGFDSLDRFDMIDIANKGLFARFLVRAIRVVTALRWLGYLVSPSTIIVAIRNQ
jgi:ubiquinone/menaquinone biosynthesis C-methylase UbiE